MVSLKKISFVVFKSAYSSLINIINFNNCINGLHVCSTVDVLLKTHKLTETICETQLDV